MTLCLLKKQRTYWIRRTCLGKQVMGCASDLTTDASLHFTTAAFLAVPSAKYYDDTLYVENIGDTPQSDVSFVVPVCQSDHSATQIKFALQSYSRNSLSLAVSWSKGVAHLASRPEGSPDIKAAPYLCVQDNRRGQTGSYSMMNVARTPPVRADRFCRG